MAASLAQRAGRITRFFKEVRGELRKVTWPSRRETVLYTSVVVVTVILVAALVWIIDGVLSQLLRLIIG